MLNFVNRIGHGTNNSTSRPPHSNPSGQPRPWSRHYAVGQTWPPLINGLSWMDPEFPSFDPVNLEFDNTGIIEEIPQPSPLQLDSLFLAERFQEKYLFGLRTYEAAVLANPQVYTTQEDSKYIMGDEIDVDESKWFPLWRRDRWLIDFKQTMPDGRQVAISMGQDAVWAEFRKAIQLANNMLKWSADGSWLKTLLAGADGIESVEVEMPLGSGNMQRIWRFKKNPIMCSKEGVLTFLNNPAFHERIYWGFHDKSASLNYSEITSELGFTQRLWCSGQLITPIFINWIMVKPLFDPSTTENSRKAALFLIASSLVHEVMHSIHIQLTCSVAMQQDLGAMQSGPDGAPMFEIFGLEGWAEAGHSFERSMFGSPLFGMESEPTGADYRLSNGASLLLGCHHWPVIDSEFWQTTYGIEDAPHHTHTEWPVPSGWTWSISTRDFWKKHVKKYGRAALMAPKMLIHRVITEHRGPIDGPRPVAAQWLDDFQPPAGLDTSLRLIGRVLHARKMNWARMRPWYPDAYALWQMTPWSLHSMRSLLHQITDVHFARRTMRDNHLAEWMAKSLTWPLEIMWSDGAAPGHSTFQLVVPRDMHTRVDEAAVTAWLFRAVGFLVIAALPAYRSPWVWQDPTRGDPNQSPWSIRRGIPLDAKVFTEVDFVIRNTWEHRWQYPDVTFNPRHQTTPDSTPDDVRLARLTYVNIAKHVFDLYTLNVGEQPGLRQAFNVECDSIESQINADDDRHDMNYTSWLEFRFRLPAYKDELLGASVSRLLDFRALAAPGSARFTPGQSINPSDRYWAEEVAGQVSVGAMPGFAYNSIARSAVPAGERPRRHEVPYFTIGEMYDQVVQQREAFVLVEDGFDLNIYRRADVAAVLRVLPGDMHQLTKRTYYGRQLFPRVADAFRKENSPLLPLGRVVEIMREDDVTAGNGRDGNPLWIRMQDTVFDITHLQCTSNPELKELLSSSPGGDPSLALMKKGYCLAAVRNSLLPWRVGLLPPRASKLASRHAIKIFTEKTLRRHEFKETGMYVAVKKKVYNITDYAELHPGGVQMLAENAGRDVTELFEKLHSLNHETILERMEEIEVGVLVDTRLEAAQNGPNGLSTIVRPDEIMFKRAIFSVTALQESGKHDDLVDQLKPYLGTDATEALVAEEGDSGPLLKFSAMSGFIVAVMEPPSSDLPEITVAELQRYDGRVNKSEGWKNAAFVAVEGLVYDVTDAVAYGSSNSNYTNLDAFLGISVADHKLSSYLQTDCKHRVRARLVYQRTPGRDVNLPEWNPRRKLPVEVQLPLWDSIPKREKPQPKDNEIAPFQEMEGVVKLEKRSPNFEEKEIFAPVPSREDLSDMIVELTKDLEINSDSSMLSDDGTDATTLVEGFSHWVDAFSPGTDRLAQENRQQQGQELRRRMTEQRRAGRQEVMPDVTALMTARPPADGQDGLYGLPSHVKPQSSASSGPRIPLESAPKRKWNFTHEKRSDKRPRM